MTREELLKEIMKLPKAETDNPINTMDSINVDDLMSAIDRLNKVPDYNDLLKENQELELELSGYRQAILNNKEMLGLKAKNQELKKQLEVSNELVTQGTLTEMKLRNEVNRWRKEYQDTYKDVRIEIKEYKTQQKEFIKYLEDKIEKATTNPYTKLSEYGMNRIHTYKEILQKYKEIIEKGDVR